MSCGISLVVCFFYFHVFSFYYGSFLVTILRFFPLCRLDEETIESRLTEFRAELAAKSASDGNQATYETDEYGRVM